MMKTTLVRSVSSLSIARIVLHKQDRADHLSRSADLCVTLTLRRTIPMTVLVSENNGKMMEMRSLRAASTSAGSRSEVAGITQHVHRA